MESVSLQFQRGGDAQLLATLLAAVVLVLLGAAVAQAWRRRWPTAGLCLAAAMGPLVLAPALAVTALVRRQRGGAGVPAAGGGAIAVAAATGLGAATYYLCGQSEMLFWMILLGLQVAIAVGVFYSTVYAYLGAARLAGLMALRVAAIGALMLLLFKPALSFMSPGASRPELPVLVDRSGSMSTVDEAGRNDRYSQAMAQLSYQRERIEKTFVPRWSHFAKSLSAAPSLEALAAMKPAGEGTDQTDIALAIREAASAGQRGNLPGMLLVSDGIHNAGDVLDAAVAQAGVPIFVAGIGGATKAPAGKRNIAILSVDAPLEAIKNNIATLTVRARGTSLADVPLECQLLEEGNDTPLAIDRKGLDAKTGEASFELKWTPADRAATSQPSGSEVRKLRVFIVPQVGEENVRDNQQSVHVLVNQPRIRVLYVEGTMRREYKDLKRYLESDANLQYIGLVQVQAKRFLAQGSIEGKTLAGLPVTEADFAMFDVIILGDLDRTFLANAQIDRLSQFVNKGGGLMMIGGHNSFGPGGYGGTVLDSVLPVIAGGREQPQETTTFLPQLTAVGETHPIFEGIAGFFPGPANRRSDDRLGQLPELLGCVTVVGPRAGASLLAVHGSRRNEQGPLVVLAVQNYGAGRSAAFTADTTWQWNMQLRALGKDSPYQRFWGQMVRWLANVETKVRGQNTQVLVRVNRAALQAGQTLSVLSRVQDGRAQRSTPLQVSATVIPDDPKLPSETIALTPRDNGSLHDGQWPTSRQGGYRIKVAAVDEKGITCGSDELAVAVVPHSSEMERLERNAELLERVADKSGGQYMDISHLPELVDEMTRRQQGLGTEGPKVREVPLYSFGWLFLAFATLVTVEWLLRRQWQLH